MELHARGWQVYRAYIDEKFDFVIMKTFCSACQSFSSAYVRKTTEITSGGAEKKHSAVTNLCQECESDSLRMLVRFVQVKTSEGIDKGKEGVRDYSFHPKIRYHLADGRVFYAWVQVWDENNVNFYIFHTDEVSRFDNISLKSYQISDNQQIHLDIDRNGVVANRSSTKDWSMFEDALDNFLVLEGLREEETMWYYDS